ncbi:MAG: PD-(D/E)XK nuclease family protein [Bacillota bacterium]|nr:PD-(D/E)XK nuclease family protein [Bacillota bacterium]
MPYMIYSYSRLSLYEECPYHFYKRYVEKREEPITEPLALGSAVHKAIELILKGMEKEEALFTAEMDSPLPLNSLELRTLVEKAPILQGEGLKEGVEIEKYFNLPLSSNPNAPHIQGFIDLFQLIFGTIEFTDWKTNRVKYKPTETKQLPLYAWALSKIYKIKEITGTLHFLRFFKNARERMTFSEEDMENARKWAETTANEIENKLLLLELGEPADKLFPFKPNKNCKNCPYAAECLLKNEKYFLGVC